MADLKNKKKGKKADSYHHGELKSTLIETALKMLKTKSPSELSLRELAREAGVSQAAPYRHFKNKEELIACISQQAFELKSQYMQEAFDQYKDNPLELYYACGAAYFKMGLKHPQHFKLMYNEETCFKKKYPTLMEAACSTFVHVRNMIQICQKAKIIGPGDPYHKAMNCWAVINGFTTLYANNQISWLGITQQNAENALRTLMSQYLIGSQKSLENSDFGFTPFSTKESAHHRDELEEV